MLHADRVKVPVLLVHGEEDFTVQVDQSQAMTKALTRSGVKNELVVIKDGEHSLLHPEMRLTLYRKLTRVPGRQPGRRGAPGARPQGPLKLSVFRADRT